MVLKSFWPLIDEKSPSDPNHSFRQYILACRSKVMNLATTTWIANRWIMRSRWSTNGETTKPFFNHEKNIDHFIGFVFGIDSIRNPGTSQNHVQQNRSTFRFNRFWSRSVGVSIRTQWRFDNLRLDWINSQLLNNSQTKFVWIKIFSKLAK